MNHIEKKILPKNPSPTLDQVKYQIPVAFNLLYIFILFNTFPNLFLLFSGLLVIYKGITRFILALTPNKLSQLVFSTLNQDLQKHPEPQFKIFKIWPLQVWTKFVVLSEIHIFILPKILNKFREPLDASRHHLTKFQLQKHFPHASIISSSTW